MTRSNLPAFSRRRGRTRRRAQESPSGDHSGGGDHGRGAELRLRHLEQVGEAGTAGAHRSGAQGGSRSSAEGGRSAAVHGGGGQEHRGIARARRIQRRRWEVAGWRELAGAELAAAVGARLERHRGWRVQKSRRVGGIDGGAHSGLDGVVSELGEGRTAAWRRGRSPAAGDEDGGEAALQGLPRRVA